MDRISQGCEESGHKIFVYEKAVASSPEEGGPDTFHSFAICTLCSKDFHYSYEIAGDIRWVATPDPTIKER